MQEQTGYSKTPKTSNIVASKIRIRFPEVYKGYCKGSIVGFKNMGALLIRIGFGGPFFL